MTLLELIDAVKIYTAQFEIDFGELDLARYKTIFEFQVAAYIGKHKPYTEYARISITASPYTFTTAEGIPDWVTEVRPLNNLVQSSTLSSFLFRKPLTNIDKPTLLSHYNKPSLYIEYTGIFSIKKVFNKPILVQTTDTEDYTITYLKSNMENTLLDLMTGYVLIAIGRNRRVATLIDLPFTLDAEALVSEGSELVRETKESISNGNDFHLAIG